MQPSRDHSASRDKEAELRQSKRLALSFFLGAALLFVLALALSLRLPPAGMAGWSVGLLKAFAEAAMVGALADWFAVAALFRRIPIPFVSRHTEIIPANKARIADNLAAFVHDKFLDTDSIVGLIRRHDPAQQGGGLAGQAGQCRAPGRLPGAGRPAGRSTSSKTRRCRTSSAAPCTP